MASVYPKNGTWYLKVKVPSGKWQPFPSQAKTKAEAKRLAVELQMKFDRQRMGLEPIVGSDGGGTLDQLMRWWLDAHEGGSPKRSHECTVSFVNCHIVGSTLGAMTLATIRDSDIEAFLAAKDKVLKPKSVNHLRSHIRAAFNFAIAQHKWAGTNPAKTTKKRRQPKGKPDYLRPHEIPAVLDALPDHWRPLFAAAIYTGLRKGELFALQKTDVDLSTRLLTVGRSHGRDTTKGGHTDVIPIAAELMPWVVAAIRSSTTALVFPGPGGKRWREDSDLSNVLRSALKRAGIVLGYEHVCRRRGCEHKEQAHDDKLRRCPNDGRKLWPKAIVRPIRFHDLRHTTASLLMMSGASPAATQRIMRHTDPKITTEVYGHLAPGYLRTEIDRLNFGVHSPAEETAEKLAEIAVGEGFGTYLVPSAENTISGLNNETAKCLKNNKKGMVGATGFEPAASWSRTKQNPIQTIATRHKPSQVVDFIELTRDAPVHKSHRERCVIENFGTHLVPKKSPKIRAVVELLTVRDVASRLKMSTATVYKLCENGELSHSRVSNSIRITSAAVDQYLTQQQSGRAESGRRESLPASQVSLTTKGASLTTKGASLTTKGVSRHCVPVAAVTVDSAPSPASIAASVSELPPPHPLPDRAQTVNSVVADFEIPPPPLNTQRSRTGWHEVPRATATTAPAGATMTWADVVDGLHAEFDPT